MNEKGLIGDLSDTRQMSARASTSAACRVYRAKGKQLAGLGSPTAFCMRIFSLIGMSHSSAFGISTENRLSRQPFRQFPVGALGKALEDIDEFKIHAPVPECGIQKTVFRFSGLVFSGQRADDTDQIFVYFFRPFQPFPILSFCRNIITAMEKETEKRTAGP